MLSGEWEQA